MRKMKEPLLLDGDIFYGDLLIDNMPSLISYSADLLRPTGHFGAGYHLILPVSQLGMPIRSFAAS